MKKILSLCGISLFAGIFCLWSFVRAGDLDPVGAPAPTMKTLDEVEARIPILALPMTITTSGSYYLTGDFTVTSGDGITIAADNVTLDLNGYALIGAGASTGDGIVVSAARRNIQIRNGTIRDWTEDGVSAANASNSMADTLRLYKNGGAGLGMGFGCHVRDCAAFANDGPGIVVSYNSVVLGCTSENNEGNGITTGSRCVVTDCSAAFNGGDGIEAVTGSRVINCSAGSNTGNGIKVTYHCYVSGNVCMSNGLSDGDGAGIYVTASYNRIDSNNVTANDRGIDVDGSYNIIIRNTSRGTTPYDFGPSNSYGPIVSVGGAGDFSVIANSDHPWANFSF